MSKSSSPAPTRKSPSDEGTGDSDLPHSSLSGWSERVHPLDLMTYSVGSFNRPTVKYFVDLSALKGNGQCDCPWFRCKLAPLVSAGKTARCKHIKAARERLVDDLIQTQVRREASVAKQVHPVVGVSEGESDVPF